MDKDWPRWALRAAAVIGIWACVGLINESKADIHTAKTVAYEARNKSNENSDAILNMKETIREIKSAQTEFSAKYDRNQEENQRVFRQILQAVKS